MRLHRVSARLAFVASAALLVLVVAVAGNRFVVHAGAARQMTPVERGRLGVPVLVELFTSEGCSSCPPADALLASLYRDQPVAGADIIILEEHVDYWDRLGWKDRFSSAEATARQRDYGAHFRLDDIYTPQMVVNGAAQLNGSDSGGALRAIAHEAGAGHAMRLEFESVAMHGATVRFELQAGTSLPQGAGLYAALVEPAVTTEVRAGENGGRTLHHAGVVRFLARVAGAGEVKAPGRREFTFNSRLSGERELEGMRLVVFAQAQQTGPIAAVASCTLEAPDAPANPQSSDTANRCPRSSI